MYGCRHELRSETKVLTHCILQGRDRHFHGLQRLDVPLHSCGPRTALAGAQGVLLHPRRQGQEVGKRLAQEEAVQVGWVRDSIQGKRLFLLGQWTCCSHCLYLKDLMNFLSSTQHNCTVWRKHLLLLGSY